MKALDDSDYARSRLRKGRSPRPVSCQSWTQGTEAHGVCDWVASGPTLRVLDAGGSDYRALIAGTVCGRTTELNDRRLRPISSACGLTRLVAVSGSHFAYIAAMLERALRHAGLSKGAQQLVMLLVMAAYMVFAGGAPSADSARFAWWRSHRRRSWAIAERMRLRDLRSRWPPWSPSSPVPFMTLDFGFRLRVCCSLSCSAAMSGTIYALWCRPRPLRTPCPLRWWPEWATLPLTLPVFGEVSLVSPLANLLVGPAMSGLLVTGLLGTGVAIL